MNYQQTLDFLFSQLPMYSKIGLAAYKSDLGNTIALCDHLGNPQQYFKAVHIAGTNGKGSTSHMLAAIMQKAGYKTGLYTSPHLKDFRERIRIDGKMIGEDFVVTFTAGIRPMIEHLQPSFFEITVAMAFEYFRQEKVDIAIIEVGLGGRLDSTNIINPELSVITNIGLDHMNILGDTLEKIAAEKAGIIKTGVPVVIGQTLTETQPVFEAIAKEKGAEILLASELRKVISWESKEHLLEVEVVRMHTDEVHFYALDLQGLYQLSNITTVLETVHQLRLKGWSIPEHELTAALKQVGQLTGLHGRWEVKQQRPFTVFDVAHNPDGIGAIVRQLESCTYTRLHIVTGMVKDKDITSVLQLLPGNAIYYFTQAQIPRALPAAELLAAGAAFGLHGKAFDEVNLAVKAALDAATVDDMILVCGSVFIIGEINII